ncbi:alkaline phosphatase family protein [Paenibacillus sp. GSMTC-2017]|uniref:alkaline phosphatase family protein n=1 Tax=Paenibacillus sp. GSMTC-2017 TaxID=2794350 RepID=UPI0018D638FC|nr:alkaline phosphatase family protein [Paenibacillus sp. GSMTC-2017]MBH5320387.1 alkaline phosphatase family protein [Paenibacillus sp. GSMTC-2017]
MNVLISVDGPSFKTFERYAQTFIDSGFSYCSKLITTFPSVTFNAHTTAITGNFHPNHLVYDNVLLRSSTMEQIPLYGDHELICNETLHEQTLFQSLAANGLKSCCIHWPLTSGNPYIDHLLTESSSKKRVQEGDSASVYEIDGIAIRETLGAIKSNAYNFVAVRFVGYDAMSHQYGKDSVEALHCLQTVLDYVGEIHQALAESGKAFNLIVFSDHGQSDVGSFFYPNEILSRSDWREQLANNQIRFVGDGNGSMLFYSTLAQEQNREIMNDFKEMEEVNDFYELESEGDSDLRPVGILDLNDTVCGEDVFASEDAKYVDMKSLHGYDPARVDEMNGFIICIGDGLEQHKQFGPQSIAGIAPTIAKLFGIHHPCDSKEMQDIIRELN